MKRLIIIMCGSILFTGIFAQEEVDMMSKRGVPILPEKGEIGLGINANPLLRYVGNFFNGNTNNTSASFSFMDGVVPVNTIYLKYYLEDDVAIRAGISAEYVNQISENFVIKDQDVPDPLVEVSDFYKVNNTTLGLGVDYLMYRGTGRLKGYYGAGIAFFHQTERESYKYGNPLTASNPNPESTDWQPWGSTPNLSMGSGERLLDYVTQNKFGIFAQAIVGVEYFFAPKISIGGEFGLGIGSDNFSGYYTVERYTGTEYEKETKDIPIGSNWGVTTHTTGSIFLMFHF